MAAGRNVEIGCVLAAAGAPGATDHELYQGMLAGHFRHLPVVGDAGLIGIVDIGDVCRALLVSP